MEILEERGFDVAAEPSAADALASIDHNAYDLVLTDLRMARMDGLELVRHVRARSEQLPIVVLTGYGTVSSAVDCVRAGASDYLLKPADPDALERSLRQAMGTRATGTGPGDESVGASPAWRSAVAMAEAAAVTDSTVLLLGESGTGKEVLARHVHRQSARRDASFVRVNCAAVPHEMWESEFFGHRRGAFTGASVDRDGRFLVADGGTLLLDEIGATPAAAQAKLLRVLQDGEVERLGDPRPRRVDVRLIAATNSDIEAEVACGRFRADLYHRLDVIRIVVPPLRCRPEDVAPLVRHFVQQISTKLRRPLPEVSPSVLADLAARPWPGNVRELRNTIERSLVLSPPGTFVLVGSATSGASSSTLDLRGALLAQERLIVVEALRRSGGVRKEAARLLGIDQRNLGYYVRKHAIDPDTAGS